jgi:AcrR family transcriptional regulator
MRLGWAIVPTTRAEQKERTRTLLLDAAIDCLLQDGYARTTTQRIQDRAGVSRGALLHHFQRKSDLLTAALHRVADQQVTALRAVVDSEDPSPEAFRRTVLAIRGAMSGPAFQAALELWLAARTSEELRASLLPAERRLGAEVRAILQPSLGTDRDEAELEVRSLLALLRGLEVTRTIKDDPALADTILERWIDRSLAARRA